jgi:hypothetical protein
MSINDVIKLIDTIVRGGGGLEYAQRMAREAFPNDPSLVDAALEELE